jgi:hypothetical protein
MVGTSPKQDGEQDAISTVVTDRADAFGLIKWFASRLADAHMQFTSKTWRIDVTITYKEYGGQE